jgi:hypothetical protein
VVAGASLLLSACSILYNPNNIDRVPADARRDGPKDADDAMVDDALDAPIDMPIDMLIDVPPGQLAIDATEPPTVFEGTGNGGSRNALILLDVRNLEAGTPVITIAPITDNSMSKPITISGRLVATDRAQLALSLKIPILTDTNEGQSKQFTIHVEQPNDPTNFAETTVTITGLDQYAPPAGTVDTSGTALKSLYSSITFNGAVHFSGSNPALLRSTTTVTINAALDVNAGGAGGCAGGNGAIALNTATPTPGGCGIGGGRAGANGNNADGGGGGFGTNGFQSTGNGTGAGGQPTGDNLLVTLSASAGVAGNRGNGGGGGGASLGGGADGGAGAGAIEITADGTLSVGTSGRVQATGGVGGAGGAITGAGGGGSGGAIILRASTVTQGTTGWASAAGGNGGSGAMNKGGLGRIRIDTTTADIASMVSTITPVRGVTWATDTPDLLAASNPTLHLVGGATQAYGFSLNGSAVVGIITDASGNVAPAATLVRGINDLCATVGPAVGTGQVSSTRCVKMIYLP